MAAYYQISYGTGFYWLKSYVVKVDHPTTDYGALVDILIDWLVGHDKRNILDMENEYRWDGDNIIDKDNFRIIYPDEFVEGGNCGDVLMHYGEFNIYEIDESDIVDLPVIDGT